MGKYPLRFMVFCAPLLLVSCGEGWEAQRVENVVPYGSRTAGSGVAYVRAKMLPEKELKVEPLTKVIEQAAPPVLDAETIFIDAQTKGGAPTKPIKNKVDTEAHSLNNKAISEKLASMNSDVEAVLSDVENTEISVASNKQDINYSELSAEEFINQQPKIMNDKLNKVTNETGNDELSVVKSVDVAGVAPSSGSDISEGNVIEVYENKVVKPAKEIISPKNDYHQVNPKGQHDLDDIYNDPFADF